MFMYATTYLPNPTAPDYNDRNMLFEYDIVNDTWTVILAGIDDELQWSDVVLDADVIDFREQEFLFWTNYDGIPYKIELTESVNFQDYPQLFPLLQVFHTIGPGLSYYYGLCIMAGQYQGIQHICALLLLPFEHLSQIGIP